MNSSRASVSEMEDRIPLSNRINSGTPSIIFLSRKEVAILSGISTRKLDELASSRQRPRPIKIGYRSVRYRASEVLSWLSELEAAPVEASSSVALEDYPEN